MAKFFKESGTEIWGKQFWKFLAMAAWGLLSVQIAVSSLLTHAEFQLLTAATDGKKLEFVVPKFDSYLLITYYDRFEKPTHGACLSDFYKPGSTVCLPYMPDATLTLAESPALPKYSYKDSLAQSQYIIIAPCIVRLATRLKSGPIIELTKFTLKAIEAPN